MDIHLSSLREAASLIRSHGRWRLDTDDRAGPAAA